MPLTIVLPARLPEALAEPAAAPLSLPHLERLLASASIVVAEPLEQWLCTSLGVQIDQDPPVASLRLSTEDEPAAATQARDGYWLCADPVAASVGMDSVQIGCVIDDLSGAEAAALIRSLDEVFAPDGLHFIAPSPAHWYVRSDATQNLSTVAVERVVGRSMLGRLPTGSDAAAWRSRINETQMLLHAHPVNRARVERGQVPVASCWWWGGGQWPRFAKPGYDNVIGGAPWVHAACKENGIATRPASPSAAAPGATVGGGHVDAKTLVFVEPPSVSSATGQWRALDDSCFRPLVERVQERNESIKTLVIPWIDGTLVVALAAPKRARLWQRLLGRHEQSPAAIGTALRDYMQ